MNELEGMKFDWLESNCFHLANQAQLQLGRSPLPDFSVVGQWFPKGCPDGWIKAQLDKHLKPVCRSPRDGDLVLLNPGRDALGTVIGEKILHFNGRGIACFSSVSAAQRAGALKGIWEVPNEPV